MQVVHQLGSRLKLGGVWYYTGDYVQLDEQDALALQGRGLSSPAPRGAIPKNVEKLPPAVFNAPVVKADDADEEQETEEKSVAHFNREQRRGTSGKRR